MPITVDHGPSASLLAMVSADAQRGRDERDVARNVADQLYRNESLGQQSRSLDMQAEQQAFGRDLSTRQQLFSEYQDTMNRQQHAVDQYYNNARDQQDFAQQSALSQQHNQQQIDYINQMNDDIGLRQGKLRYDDQQKQDMANLYKAQNRLLDDESMHPVDRQNGLAIIQQKLRTIRPLPVTPDEQPVSMEQKIGQMIGMWTDPRTGQQYPMTIDRSGVPKPIEFKDQPQMGPGYGSQGSQGGRGGGGMTYSDQFYGDEKFQRNELEAARKELEAEREKAIKKAIDNFDDISKIPQITGDHVAERVRQKMQIIDGARSALTQLPNQQYVSLGNGQFGMVTTSGRIQPVDPSQVPPQVIRQMQQQAQQSPVMPGGSTQSGQMQAQQQPSPQPQGQQSPSGLIPIKVDPDPRGTSRYYDPSSNQTVIVNNRTGSYVAGAPTANDMRAVDDYAAGKQSQGLIPIKVDPKPDGVSRYYDPQSNQSVVIDNRSGSTVAGPATASDLRAVERLGSGASKPNSGFKKQQSQQRSPANPPAQSLGQNFTPSEAAIFGPLQKFSKAVPWIGDALESVSKLAGRHGHVGAIPDESPGRADVDKLIAFAATIDSPANVSIIDGQPDFNVLRQKSNLVEGQVYFIPYKGKARRAVWHGGQWTLVE